MVCLGGGAPRQWPDMHKSNPLHSPHCADVQLLYDFVLETASTAMAPLYSPVAFAGASLTAAEVRVLVGPWRLHRALMWCICPSQITRVETVRMVSGGAGATHVLEVQGVLHPLMMYRMAQVLQVTQANDLVIAPQDSPGSTGLNAKLPAELSTYAVHAPPSHTLGARPQPDTHYHTATKPTSRTTRGGTPWG